MAWKPSSGVAGEVLEGERFYASVHDGDRAADEYLSTDHSKVVWFIRRNADHAEVARGELGGWGYSSLELHKHLRPAARRLARSALKVFEDIEDSRADDQDIN